METHLPQPGQEIVNAPRQLVSFDVETTGLRVAEARIVEYTVQVLDQDLGVVRTLHARLNPGVPIPPETTAIHGITDQDVAGLPGFESHADTLQELVTSSMVHGFNVRYDLDILHYELRRTGRPGVPMDTPMIDGYRLFTEDSPRDLSAAHAYYVGGPFESAHTSAADVEAAVAILRAQRARRGGPPLSALVIQESTKWLDRGRKFYRDQDGVARFAFGKHRDTPVHAQPSYLQWIVEGSTLDPDTKDVAARLRTDAMGSPMRRLDE